jgi:pSer/pThr/pTyr-binding forkhead associated (FHA) protein
VQQGRALLEDLDSKNGTFVDDQPVEDPVELRPGARIQVGPVMLIFRVSSAQESTSTGLTP